MLARLLLNDAMEHHRSGQNLRMFVAANLLQDAVEVFLLAVAESVGAKLKEKAEFANYLDSIDKAIEPATLPFRTQLLRLNRIRVHSKHHLVQPQPNDIQQLSTVVREFFTEVSRAHLSVDFETVHLIDLIRDDAQRNFLVAAHDMYEKGQYANALIESRKAFYLAFEINADVSGYADETKKGLLGMLGPGWDAPSYARSAQYVRQNVATPFDYIVLDRDKLNAKLLSDGIDVLVFWNVWRLTPALFRTKGGEWLIKHELGIMESPNLQVNATYVLDQVTQIILQLQERAARLRHSRGGSNWVVYPRRPAIPVYEKADAGSAVAAHVAADAE